MVELNKEIRFIFIFFLYLSSFCFWEKTKRHQTRTSGLDIQLLSLETDQWEISSRGTLCQQGRVVSTFNYFSFVQNRYRVAVLNRAKPMRNHNARPPDHHSLERVLHHALRLAVQSARCFIQEQHGRVLQNRASYGNPLLLPTR